MHVTRETYHGWRVLGVAVLAPWEQGNDREKNVLAVVAVGKPETLLEHAAHRGFRGLSVAQMGKLFNVLQIPLEGARKPTSQAGLLTALGKHVLGAAWTDKAEEIAARRVDIDDDHDFMTKEHTFTEAEFNLLTAEDQDEWHEAYESELAKEKEAWQRARLQKCDLKAKVKKAGGGGGLPEAASSSGASSSGGVAVVAVVKEKIVVKAGGYTQPQAKRFLPPGATITKSVVRTSYWQIRAHYLEHSISKAFDSEVTGESEHSALVYLLSLAWAKYSGCDGEQPCPWEMDVALF